MRSFTDTTDWFFEASNDGTNFTVIDSQINQFTRFITSNYTVLNSIAYRYYRLRIIRAEIDGDSNPGINTFEILNNGVPTTGCQIDGADTDTVTGNMLADPTGMTGTTVSGCPNTATYTPSASSTTLVQGTTTSASLLTVGNAQSCKINVSGGTLRQSIPAGQTPGTYTIGLTFTAV